MSDFISWFCRVRPEVGSISTSFFPRLGPRAGWWQRYGVLLRSDATRELSYHRARGYQESVKRRTLRIWQLAVALTFVIVFATLGMCAPTDASFFISNFLGKCLDTDAASRNANAFASLSKCRQSSSKRIRVKEVSGGTREVTLQAAGKCLAPALNVIVQ